MELLLALLLAASLVALASTWSALRTERARAHRAADRAGTSRREPSLPPQDEPAAPFPGARDEKEPPVPVPPTPPLATVPEATPASMDRVAAALVAPAERLATCIDLAGPAVAGAAERLRTPLPPAASAPAAEDAAAPEFGAESVERALATAERISDERSRLADEVRSLRSALERVAALDGGLGRSLTELSRSAEALLPFSSSISGLGDRANLLGLNVSLLAARAGDAGAPFEEAAVELRGLFEEARRLSRELSEAGRRTDGGVRRVATIVEESTEAAAAGLERGGRAAERLGALDGHCGQLERTLAEAVRNARTATDAGASLARRLEATRTALDAKAGEAARLRVEAEAARAALRTAAERIEALRVDGGALRAAVVRVTSGA
jgi:hypothetical protein